MVPIRFRVLAVLSFCCSSSMDMQFLAFRVITRPAMPKGMQQSTRLMIDHTSSPVLVWPLAPPGP